jgi:hypothetical protein
MDASQKIPVLLAEYNTLRAEVLAARGNVAQASSILTATLMADFAFAGTLIFNQVYKWWLALPFFIMLFVFGYFWALVNWNETNTRNFTRRLREIEKQIHEITGDPPVLLWETVHGWGGMFRQTNPNFKGYKSFPPEQPWLPLTPPPQSN